MPAQERSEFSEVLLEHGNLTLAYIVGPAIAIFCALTILMLKIAGEPWAAVFACVLTTCAGLFVLLKLLVRYTIAISADYQLHVVVNSIFGERRRVLDLRKCRECCVEKIDFPSGESYRVAELKTVTGTHRIWSFTGVGSARQFAQRVNAWVGRQDEVQPVLLDALCCVIAADGRVSSGERSLAIEGVTRLRPTLNPQWIDEQISLFVKRVNKSGFRQVVEETAAEIKDNSARLRDWVDFRSALLEVAKADGSVTRNQQLVINKLMAALEQGGATDTDGAHHVT